MTIMTSSKFSSSVTTGSRKSRFEMGIFHGFNLGSPSSRRKRRKQVSIKTWFGGLLICTLLPNLGLQLYLHRYGTHDGFNAQLFSAQIYDDQSEHAHKIIHSQSGADADAASGLDFGFEDNKNDAKKNGHNHEHSEKTEFSRDCVQGTDYILADDNANQQMIIHSSLLPSLRIIPYKVHIILPFHIEKSCIPTQLFQTVQKWHLPHHSIYIHDANSIYRLTVDKYRNSPTLSQFYLGLFGAGTGTGNRKDLVDDGTYSLFYNDVAKFLVLWEYGGLVISDLSYEPSTFLLKALQEEQEEVQFLSKTEHSKAELKKHKRKMSKSTSLFTTNTTQFIIETNESSFQFTKEFFASIPYHPLLHHLLTKTIQRYQKQLFNTTTTSSWQSSSEMNITSYHDDWTWDQHIYKFFVSKFYTHKLRKPTQISPPNVNRWNYLFEMMNKSSIDISNPATNDSADGNYHILRETTITILDRDKYDRQSLLKKVQPGQDTTIATTISGTENNHEQVRNFSSLSSAVAIENFFKPIQTNISSLLGIVGSNEEETFDSNYPDAKSSQSSTSCPIPLHYINSILTNDLLFYKDKQFQHSGKIPPIIHITGKTKCLSKKVHNSVHKWHSVLPNHSLLYYDNNAVQRLFQNQEWAMFPQLKQAIKCINSGAGLADVFRYLLLWEYGGIYTDIDNEPGQSFEASIIKDDMDAMFEVEIGKFPSQYFFAVSPHHPVMYFAVQNAIDRLLDVNDIHLQKIPFVTGPGALKAAVIDTIGGGDGYLSQGTYNGIQNRSITIIGSYHEAVQNTLICRHCIHFDNDEDFHLMNMTRYQEIQTYKNGRHVNCLGIIHEDYLRQRLFVRRKRMKKLSM